jgi:hypothetical protein
LRHESTQQAAIFLLVPLVAALACAPLLHAGFHTEDFTWLALARQLDKPWALFHKDVAFAYFYRPTGLLFWRAITQIAGTDAWLQNLSDLLLQALNATLVACLAARLSRNRNAGIMAGLVFACLPAASGTALWMSDRFDPVSLCCGLVALLAFERARRRSAWLGMALFLLLCLTAKEVGYAVAAAMLALLAWTGLTRREWHPWKFAAVLLPVTLALALHAVVVKSIDAALDSTQSLHALWRGVGYWWLRFPSAIFGFREPPTWAWLLLADASLLAAAGVARAIRQRQRDTLRLAIVGATLLVVPAILQWPVTQLVLGSTAALAFTANLRFYYVAVGGLALLWSAGYAGLQATRSRWLLLAATLALAVQWFATANVVATAWANDTRAFSPRYLALSRDLGTISFPAGCRIELHAPDFPPDFAHFADVIIKGGAPRGASVMGCVIFAGGAPYMSIVNADLCTEANWRGLAIRTVQGKKLLAPVGNLCMLSFDPPHFAADGLDVHRFEVDASGRLSPILP